MMFKIDPAIFEKFPGFLIGVVVARGVHNDGLQSELFEELKREVQQIPAKIGSTPIAEHPQILPWREAYRAFGAKPKDYSCSIENLTRRIQKGDEVRHINTLVDAYNLISLQYLLPVGGEDLAAVTGDIQLTFATDHEPPVQLLGEKEARAPHVGEVIYKDDVGALCRRWNWKEADRTKLTPSTTEAILVIEALPPVSGATIEQATTALARLVQQYAGATISQYLLDKTNAAITLS